MNLRVSESPAHDEQNHGEESGETGGATPGDAKPSEEEREQIEADREERLAQENRPEGAEVDNSEREFDPETGMFTDSEGHDEADQDFLPDEEL